MVEPISLTVAVAGLAVAGTQLALSGASSAYEAYDIKRNNKRNKKQDAIAAVQGKLPTDGQSNSAANPTPASVPSQPTVNPYAYAVAQGNAYPSGMVMNGFNADGNQGWATMTTTEIICMQNGKPVTKESKLELLQSIQYQQMQASALPINMSQVNQMSSVVALDSKPPMPQSYPAVSDSKTPMLPMHCSIAPGVPAQNSASWQQTTPPPPYQAQINQPMVQTNQPMRKRDRWIHFK